MPIEAAIIIPIPNSVFTCNWHLNALTLKISGPGPFFIGRLLITFLNFFDDY